MKERPKPPADPVSGERRTVLLRLGAGALIALGTALGCHREGVARAGADVTRIPLAEIPAGGRLVVMHRNLPVEIRRGADGVQALSLQCTHMGCHVAWREDLGMYRCPCHDGRYDATGKPLYGPPPKPLDTIAVHVRGDEIILGG